MNSSLVLGIDIGGSHITSAVTDINAGHVFRVSYVRKFVDSHQGANEIITAWADAIKQSFSLAGLNITKIGIAMPGPLDYETGVCWIKDQDKYEHLYGLNIKEMLAQELSIAPEDIRIMNDACSFLQGEVLGTLDTQYKKVMGFTLGTGLGSAVYNDGTVTDADLWRMPFREGMAEDYLSTRWFIKRYTELSGKSINNVKQLLDVINQDPNAMAVFNEFGKNLGMFLNEAVDLHKPEAIVLGGNISKQPELYLNEAEEILSESGNKLPISLARLGEEAALIGAAGVWKAILALEGNAVGK